MDEFIQIRNDISIPNVEEVYVLREKDAIVLRINEKISVEDKLELMKNNACTLLLDVSLRGENYVVNCISREKKIRALEILDFIFGKYGIVDGDTWKARGKITKVILDIKIAEMEISDYLLFFMMKVKEYFSDTLVINSLCAEVSIAGMEIYQKKNVPWAVVKTEDIGVCGEGVIIKSLENTVGTEIIIAEDTYIMIGSRGEVYDIKKDKFISSYYETSDKLDVFDSMFDFIPTVIKEEKSIPIDEIAHICYPSMKNGIYAKQITKRTKVFGKNNNEDYFIGNVGDYLAVRTDDLTDVYIIKKDIFTRTYERK